MTSEACNSSSMGTSLVFVGVRNNMESIFSQVRVSDPRTCTLQLTIECFFSEFQNFHLVVVAMGRR
jgi:hypothetical protein